MKKLFTILPMVLVLCFTFSCQKQTETLELTDAQRQEIADIIKSRNQELTDLDWKNEYEKGKSFWVDDKDASWMGNPGLFVQGIRILPDWEAMDALFDPMNERRSSTNFTINKAYISVLTDKQAVYVVEGKFSVTNLEGETGPEYPWTATSVWINQSSEWKILHYHQSWSDTPIKTEEEK